MTTHNPLMFHRSFGSAKIPTTSNHVPVLLETNVPWKQETRYTAWVEANKSKVCCDALRKNNRSWSKILKLNVGLKQESLSNRSLPIDECARISPFPPITWRHSGHFGVPITWGPHMDLFKLVHLEPPPLMNKKSWLKTTSQHWSTDFSWTVTFPTFL